MLKQAGERGAALILLLGIVAALAILATTLVMVIANQQAATAHVRAGKTSAYYAEAALDQGVQYSKGLGVVFPTASPSASPTWMTPAQLNAALSAMGLPPGATVSYVVYDNLATVNQGIAWDSNKDGMMWLQVTVTYQGKTTRMRVLIRQSYQSVVQSLPRAVLFADAGIRLNGQSDLYALNNDGTPDVSGSPFPTKVMTGENLTGTAYATLSPPNSSVQSLGIQYNGSLIGMPASLDDKRQGGVGLLSDYFDQGAQADLGDEAQSGARAASGGTDFANAGGTSALATKFTPTNLTTTYLTSINASFDSGTKTYTFNNDLVVSGNLTLKSSGTGAFPTGTTFNFKSLYVKGDLSLGAGTWSSSQSGPTFKNDTWTPTSGTGNVEVNATAVYVQGNFTIGGASSAFTDQLGPICVERNPARTFSSDPTGSCYWNGTTSVDTTYTHTDSTTGLQVTEPGPVWVGFRLKVSGTFTDTLGDTWVNGGADTNNTVLFAGPSSGSASQLWCPLLATTEQTMTKGLINFGDRTHPMTYYMMCDNDGGYVNTCDWGSTGTFYGLMVIMEASISISGGNGTTPNIEGAIFCGSPDYSGKTQPAVGTIASTDDITLQGNSTAAYNQAIIDLVANKSITTTTLTTTVVPGSWQQLSAAN
jgi:hypothetical protein